MPREKRRSRPLIPIVSIVSMLAGVLSITLAVAGDMVDLKGVPAKTDLALGALAGVTGFIAVVSAALQRRSFAWTLMGIVGVGVGIALGLSVFQT